ncbi:Cof-type HAD-IIB family hydrolase [Velocimicrobium porci]|uniref:HAD family phosphatase n=1 Tax=Velocimicrobium porci TaxID=2606634 RepID=A0A6L5XUP9_9FIRM|nr:Cof-type HAD-IIB family hydrolase [Velocimicrobium porci]MSS62540.1 HAD family phosphatase [Velocimicrobium porci]
MAYEIIVLDLDGTLTNSHKKITPKTKELLFQIQEDGIKVVLASGRPTTGIVNLADELCLDKYGGYILSFNGAKIINYETKDVIYNSTLPSELLPAIYETARNEGVGILTYKDDIILLGNGMDEYNQLESKINGIPLKEADDFLIEISTTKLNKCLLTGKPEHMAIVEEHYKEQFGNLLNIYRSEPFFLEIMPPNIDKAYSLSKLLKHLGLSRKQMICCGDGFNDLSMIQYAGLGVAMENAQPAVKKAADFITLSNDEDGIAHVIQQFILSMIDNLS